MLRSASVMLVAATLITSCEKSLSSPTSADLSSETNSRRAEEVTEYQLYTPSGQQAGVFRISLGEKETAIVEIQLNAAVRVPGATFAAQITHPQRNGARPLYVKLNNVNGETGYGITPQIYDGNGIVMATQLRKLIEVGYSVEIWNGSTLVARS